MLPQHSTVNESRTDTSLRAGDGQPLLRRTWLHRASRTLVGSCLLTLANTGKAIDPFKRSIPGRLRLSMAAYSLRQYLEPNADGKSMDLFQFVDYCAEHGLHGAELTSYYFPNDPTPDYLLNLKRHCHLRGVEISGGAIRNDFCHQDASVVEASVQHTRKWIDIYAQLGAPVIRIFAGDEQPGEAVEETIARCVAACEIVCKYAEQKGLFLALENHGGITATAAGLLKIVQPVNSTAFGVNFDSGNFHSTSDPYAELMLIAPYAVNAQLKVEMQIDGQAVPTDLRRVLEILSASGYSGWVALEYESSEEPFTAIPNLLKELQGLFAEFG